MTKFKSIILVLMLSISFIFFLGTVGCETKSRSSFVYTKDHRTGLCYAYVTDNSIDRWYPTQVPCTDKVLEAIKQDKVE